MEYGRDYLAPGMWGDRCGILTSKTTIISYSRHESTHCRQLRSCINAITNSLTKGWDEN